jgi:hypothetical protein
MSGTRAINTDTLAELLIAATSCTTGQVAFVNGTAMSSHPYRLNGLLQPCGSQFLIRPQGLPRRSCSPAGSRIVQGAARPFAISQSWTSAAT